MGVRKFRAYLKWMKRALLQKFMIEIDGEQEEELTEALEEAIREIYLRDGTIIADDVALGLANDVSMTAATFSLSARARRGVALLPDGADKSSRSLARCLQINVIRLDDAGLVEKLVAFVAALRVAFFGQGAGATYNENGEGDQDAGYLAGFLKDVLDGASPTTWTPHPSSHNKKILDFLKGDLTGVQEDTLWRRAKLYNTFAKLQK